MNIRKISIASVDNWFSEVTRCERSLRLLKESDCSFWGDALKFLASFSLWEVATSSGPSCCCEDIVLAQSQLASAAGPNYSIIRGNKPRLSGAFRKVSVSTLLVCQVTRTRDAVGSLSLSLSACLTVTTFYIWNSLLRFGRGAGERATCIWWMRNTFTIAIKINRTLLTPGRPENL